MANRAGSGMGRFQVGVLVALPLIPDSRKMGANVGLIGGLPLILTGRKTGVWARPFRGSDGPR